MSDRISYGPWHTLTVTDAVWYCDTVADDDPAGCVTSEDCKGHDAPHQGRIMEQDRTLDCPDECKRRPCCCTWDVGVLLTFPATPSIDPECEAGRHDCCLNVFYGCWTEEKVFEWWDVEEMPTTAGVYRVRIWESGPDHNGEYDGGIDLEPVEAVSGS